MTARVYVNLLEGIMNFLMNNGSFKDDNGIILGESNGYCILSGKLYHNSGKNHHAING